MNEQTDATVSPVAADGAMSSSCSPECLRARRVQAFLRRIADLTNLPRVSRRVSDLRLAQGAVGHLWVLNREQRLRARKDDGEIRTKLWEDPAIVVTGPPMPDEGEGDTPVVWIVDGTHQSAALWRMGYLWMPTVEGADWADLSLQEFFETMRAARILRAKDQNGRDIPIEALPKRAWRAPNDQFRSLAGRLQKAGEFDKARLQIEFIVADALRARWPFRWMPDNRPRRAYRWAKLTLHELIASGEIEGVRNRVATDRATDVDVDAVVHPSDDRGSDAGLDRVACPGVVSSSR